MRLSILGQSLLLSSVGQTTALAVLGGREPSSNGTTAGPDKRAMGIAAISTRLKTIYLSGDERKRRTAELGFDYRVEGGLWALCPTTVAAVSDCLVGACYDKFICSTGCGYPDRTSLGTINCTVPGIEFCSTAILSHQTEVEAVTNFACGENDGVVTYMGFTTDPPVEDETTSTSTTSPSTTASGSQPTLTPGPSITPNSGPSNTPSNTASSSQSTSGGTTISTGAIIGGAVGGLAVLCGFAIAIIWLMRRSRIAEAKSAASSMSNSPPEFKSELEAYERERAELEAYERERAELGGRGLTEMSAQEPAAYDTASRQLRYPPMTPVELPAAGGWK